LRYERLNARWEIGECEYRAQGWPQSRRCIVARRRMEEAEPEPTLFTLERHAYRAWISNLSLTPAGVWHYYDGRAGMEPRIRELREDFALRKVPTRAFAANALYQEVVRLAYNLVTAFQQTCVPEAWRDLTLSKLRHKLFWLSRTSPGRDNSSNLSSPYPDLWTAMSSSLEVFASSLNLPSPSVTAEYPRENPSSVMSTCANRLSCRVGAFRGPQQAESATTAKGRGLADKNRLCRSRIAKSL
jgi:Transposase DDE domain group 1